MTADTYQLGRKPFDAEHYSHHGSTRSKSDHKKENNIKRTTLLMNQACQLASQPSISDGCFIKKMPSRISGACNGCRSKKQKCSGDRTPPGCAQCIMAGVECTWPEQRKRGPSKGYIEALESRLSSAEKLLLALLPSVDERLLDLATEKASGHSRNDENPRTSPALLNKKTGADYWDDFPLDSSGNVRRWQRDCEMHSHTQPQAYSNPQSQIRSDTRRGHSRATSYSRSDDYRSSMAAATAIAGMRHRTRSPNTPAPTSSMALEPAQSPMIVGGTPNPMRSVASQCEWMQAPDQPVMGGNIDHVMSTGNPSSQPWSGPMNYTRTDLNLNQNPNSNLAGSNTHTIGMYNPDFPQHLFW